MRVAQRTAAVILAALLALSAVGIARAEVSFGNLNVRADSRARTRTMLVHRSADVAGSGRFFATSDYGYEPGGEDRCTSGRFGEEERDRHFFTRGQKKGKRLPTPRAPWLSGNGRTLFGVRFDEPPRESFPGQFDQFEGGKVLFDKAVIHWGRSVPGQDEWGAAVVTEDGVPVKLAIDREKTIYPGDLTVLSFPASTVRTFYVAVDGTARSVEVTGLEIHVANRRDLRNGLIVWQPDAYRADYSPEEPGLVEAVMVANDYLHFGRSQWRPWAWSRLFFKLGPFIEWGGKRHYPEPGDCPVEGESEGGRDRLQYGLTFKLPGADGPTVLTTAATFHRRIGDSIQLEMQAEGLPAGAKLGYEFFASDKVFGESVPAAEESRIAVDGRAIFDTPAGHIGVSLSGADQLSLKRFPGEPGIIRYSELRPRIRFSAIASGPELKVGFSLPIGTEAAVRPRARPFTWYQGTADQGAPGYAPFRLGEDLELLEAINCGDPNDPHKCYDVSNDPAVEVGKRKYGSRLRPRSLSQSGENEYGFLPFIDEPGKGQVPVRQILGEPCREIGEDFGIYFRYDLDSRLHNRVLYLLVVEHAFDQTRSGEFHSIMFDGKHEVRRLSGNHLLGGLDTGPPPHERRFRKECIVCRYDAGPNMESEIESGKWRFGLVFSNVWRWGHRPPDKRLGPAVRRIELYRVKRMPALPDVKGLLPADGSRRTVCVLTEGARSHYLHVWPRVTGYDCVWTYKCPPAMLLGNTSYAGPRRTSFHPGTLKGNEWLFEAAEQRGLYLNVHLGQLLHLGFEGTGHDSFFANGIAKSYCGEEIPISPRPAELDHLAMALRNALGRLAKYRSLRSISLADSYLPHSSLWSQRNLEDFARQTGIDIEVSPFGLENLQTLLTGPRDTLRRWMAWAGRERFEFRQWLLHEIRKYRADLFLTLQSSWYANMVSKFQRLQVNVFGFGDELAQAGIGNYTDFLRLLGTDPALYRGVAGFAFELETGNDFKDKKNAAVHRFYGEDWFKSLRGCFTDGISIFLNYNYDESTKPLHTYYCTYFKSKKEYCRGMVEALLCANARRIVLPTYEEPWLGRMADLRRFAVAFRLLPFAPPEPFEGEIRDPASQAVIRKHGDRYALMNAGRKPTTVTLGLPAGRDRIYDLSSGMRRELKTRKGADGKPTVEIPMDFWSLKTLSFE